MSAILKMSKAVTLNCLIFISSYLSCQKQLKKTQNNVCNFIGSKYMPVIKFHLFKGGHFGFCPLGNFATIFARDMECISESKSLIKPWFGENGHGTSNYDHTKYMMTS